ncbi:uncharacterized protein NDAI_0J00550 [Naumovozyma dairenensis CBS 421]|uniref:VanZ-like domain-containing protein n=1 Tax=Naumovozyma dairenensis (strain ATCC 10597 / BCRC 20456 / CBS 421 / NBRC 0211 / NRRL Y-12639) TaxID=1071378 RepID=G0WGL9_NAUDC|nr:hypothetical protein NDAI_0J00550 [Naumovozyma dairenensis CBS 421]CCD26947.1 hypothetical protein NDAI_0J00550 [Naumovozyma dairenensis CBS 421]
MVTLFRRNYVILLIISSIVSLFLGITTTSSNDTTTRSFALTLLISQHDKLTHFIVFCLESWLFVKCFKKKLVPILIPRKFIHIRNMDEFETANGTLELNRSNSDDDTLPILGFFLSDHFQIVHVKKYWLAIIICSLGASILSEFMQAILTRGKRVFDTNDIITNILGSLFGITIAYGQERHMT